MEKGKFVFYADVDEVLGVTVTDAAEDNLAATVEAG